MTVSKRKNFSIRNLIVGLVVGFALLFFLRNKYSSNVLAKTVNDLENTIGLTMRQMVENAGLEFPPESLILKGDKTLRLLTVYGVDKQKRKSRITSYPFTGFSGKLGPKLKEGDMQIPEGIYETTALNPQSSFHLSIRVGYPNAFDRKMAQHDERTDLGGDIYIHGSSSTIGCIPIGDKNIEQLFYLVAAVGLENTTIVIVPYDLKDADLRGAEYEYPWQMQLYSNIQSYLEKHLP